MKIINYMSHNILLYKLVPVILNNRLVHEMLYFKIRNTDKNRKAREKEFREFCEINASKLHKAEEMLEDEESKVIFRQILEYRKSGKVSFIKPHVSKPQYWADSIIKFSGHDIFVDGGAYIGDTILQFLKYSDYKYDKVYAWEPDERNLKMCKRVLKNSPNIQYIPCGMWNDAGTLAFSNGANSASAITDDEEATAFVSVNSIDAICSDGATIIKMDIEGAELEALRGGVNTIRKYKPQLAICIYHKPEHLYEIAFFIKKLVPEYKLYIRQHEDFWTETVLYAVI